MSTKAIGEALELLGKFIEDTGGCDHSVNICVCGEGIVLRDARAELEAIEKAARALDENLAAQVFASNPEQVEQALDLMESIAKQEP
jgi:hypothetical protein